jgi:O-antigen/teichoic acid export membrane protein
VSNEVDGLSPYHSARGALYLITKALIIGLSAALFYVLIARLLPTVSDLGIFQGLQSLITVSVTLTGSGLSRAATRFISLYIGAGKEKEAGAIYSAVFRIGLITAAVLCIALYILAPYIADLFFHDLDLVGLIRLVSVDIFLFSLVIYLTSLMYALQLFRKAVIISIFNSLLKFVAASVLISIGKGIDGIIIGFIIGDALGLVLFLHTVMPNIRKTPASIREIKPVLTYSLPLYGYSILVYLSTEIDLYLLLILSNLSVVGIYSPAIFLGTMLVLGLTAIDQSIAPFFSRVYAKSGIRSLEDLSKSASRYIFLIYIPISSMLLACTPLVLTGFLGERYYESIYPAIIIIVTIASTSMYPIFNNILISAGHTRIFFSASIMALSFQLAISFIIIPYIGPVGAAIAKVSAFILLFLFPTYRLKQISGLLPYDSSALKMGLIGSVIMSSVIFVLNLYLSNPLFLPLSLIIGLLTYFLFCRFTATVHTKDIEIVKKVLPANTKWLIAIIAKVLIK